MNSDLIEALRANVPYTVDEEWALRRDAADEIERLNAIVDEANQFLVRAFSEQQRLQEMVYSIYKTIKEDTVEEEEPSRVVTSVHFQGDYRDV